MLKVRIIPCLDVDKGRVVKGINFLELRDAGDPVECAKRYTDEGADELVFLDITASSDNRNTMLDTIRRVSEVTFIPFTVGGGIRSVADMEMILKAGSDKVSINTSAVTNPELISEGAKHFGTQCIVVAVDSRKVNGIDKVFTHGGRKETEWKVVDWCKKAESLGAGEILLTSWDKDGTKSGFDNQLLREVSNTLNIPVIASGGGGTMEHFVTAAKEGNASAILAASVFHFGEIKIKDLKEYMAKNGVNVRLDI
ncbi:MAG TPA: imidazole glycerol phosphate synthase subunit HisF [Spirochaetota bacterium]|nr:imidazole glycerol phosphate synthase subunit HisF [Spirochaetota bacterium]